MNGKRARQVRAMRARQARARLPDFGMRWSRRFIRPIEPGEFGPDREGWAPRGGTHVEVMQWCDPLDDTVLLELRTALPPSRPGRGLCVVEACTPETARIAPRFLPSMAAIGTHFTDEGEVHPLWAYLVDLP